MGIAGRDKNRDEVTNAVKILGTQKHLVMDVQTLRCKAGRDGLRRLLRDTSGRICAPLRLRFVQLCLRGVRQGVFPSTVIGRRRREGEGKRGSR